MLKQQKKIDKATTIVEVYLYFQKKNNICNGSSRKMKIFKYNEHISNQQKFHLSCYTYKTILHSPATTLDSQIDSYIYIKIYFLDIHCNSIYYTLK